MNESKTTPISGLDIISCIEKTNWNPPNMEDFYIRIPCRNREHLEEMQSFLVEMRNGI